MAFLHQIRHRQAIMAEARRNADDKAHMGGRQLVQCLYIAVVSPVFGQFVLVVTGQKRR